MSNEPTPKIQSMFTSIRRALAEMNHGQRRLVEINAEFDESAAHPKL